MKFKEKDNFLQVLGVIDAYLDAHVTLGRHGRTRILIQIGVAALTRVQSARRIRIVHQIDQQNKVCFDTFEIECLEIKKKINTQICFC